MTTAQHIATHLRQLIGGPNQTGSNLIQHLDDVTLEEATARIYGLNTIAQLVFHINYYINAVNDVLKGKPLTAKDSLSYDLPALNNATEWQLLKETLYSNIEQCGQLAGQLTDENLKNIFVLEKYGTYQRNLLGLLEHSYYHLGQIVLLKKIIQQQLKTNKR